MPVIKIKIYGPLAKKLLSGEIELEVSESDTVGAAVSRLMDGENYVDVPLIYLLDGRRISADESIGNGHELEVIQPMFGG